MDTRYGVNPLDYRTWDTDRLRAEFLVEGAFGGGLRLTYTHIDRMVVGAAVPGAGTLTLADGAMVGTPAFFDAREAGIANLGGPGTVTVDGQSFRLENRDILYVGRGARALTFAGEGDARFYLNAVPAGADHPHRLIRRAEAKRVALGSTAKANVRSLAMYIHPEVAPSCLLLMGITDLAPGSVWNTMPPHVHERRMEAYAYFDLSPEDRVVKLVGTPEHTRSLIVADGDIVLSPAWSIHMGAGTGPYAFVWGMTGENQAYNDVTPVPVRDLR
jgi:4-deoxy-L-threo-5-hexosulose-uronate ketol-isomerase